MHIKLAHSVLLWPGEMDQLFSITNQNKKQKEVD